MGKAAKFLSEKLSTSEVTSQKPHGGGGGGGEWKTPPPSAFRVKGVTTSIADRVYMLTAVCGKAVETVIQTCQHSIVNFHELKQLICRWPYLSIDR